MGAQAQAVAVDAATAQQSLTCVKCLVQLVRGARAGVAWLRVAALTADALRRRCTRSQACAASSRKTPSSAATSRGSVT